MKILHLIDIPWWSGLSSYAFDCMKAHAASGHRIWLACEKDSLSHKRGLESGMDVLPIHGREFWRSALNLGAVGSIILKNKPDLIVAHTGSTHWIAWVWGKLRGIPFIRTRAISQRVRGSAFNKKIYSDSRYIVTASGRLRDECLERLSPALSGKILALYPPVENPALLQDSGEGVKRPEGKKIGILARLDPKKGYHVFLKAAQIVQASHPDAEFHIAGSQENLDWPEVLREARALGLKKTIYHGFLTQAKVWDFLRACSVGVIASLESEEVSRALLEWMSGGRPVVATSVGCIPEVLKDGEGGFLVPPGDAAQMADKIKTLLQDPGLWARMGNYNLDLSRKTFSTARFRADWHKILYDEPQGSPPSMGGVRGG